MRWLRGDDRQRVLDSARLALDEGRVPEAADGFRRAIELGETSSAVWFNLGLAEKLQRNWPASVAANRRAAELDTGSVEAHWNLGVAATALRDWQTAHWAWRGLGLEVGPTTQPPTADFGHAPVRLGPTADRGGEVVWGRRIDPCRVRVESVPTPESGHRFGDVVLHDVVPRGTRQVGEHRFSVFDELDRMDPSDVPTHDVTVTAPTPADVRQLELAFVDAGLGADDWTAIQWMCATCSLGDAHRHDGGDPEPMWEPVRRIGLAAPPQMADRLLAEWVRGGSGRGAGERREVG